MSTTDSPSNTEPRFGPQFDQINYDMGHFIASRYSASKPVAERFLTWWNAFALYAHDHPFDLVYMEEIATSHLYPFIGQQASSAFYVETRNILRDGQEAGEIKKLDPGLINQFTRCSIINVIKANMTSGKTLSREQLSALVQCCWDGIRVR